MGHFESKLVPQFQGDQLMRPVATARFNPF